MRGERTRYPDRGAAVLSFAVNGSCRLRGGHDSLYSRGVFFGIMARAAIDIYGGCFFSLKARHDADRTRMQ